jgi:Ca2+-transporting ATPase
VDARRPARFFTRGEWALILASGLLLTAVVVFGYDRSLGSAGVEHARAMALATLTLASAALAAALSRLRTAAARVVSGVTVAVSAVVIQVPLLAALVHVTPLHLDDWAIALAGAAAAVALPMAVGLAGHRDHPAPPLAPRVTLGLATGRGGGGHVAGHP